MVCCEVTQDGMVCNDGLEKLTWRSFRKGNQSRVSLCKPAASQGSKGRCISLHQLTDLVDSSK